VLVESTLIFNAAAIQVNNQISCLYDDNGMRLEYDNIVKKAILVFCLIIITDVFILYSQRNEIRGAVFLRADDLAITGGVISSSNVKFNTGRASGFIYQITYTYRVNQKRYISDQINFSTSRGGSDRSLADKYVEQYPIGRQVIVYYLKNDPAFSVLEPYNTGTTEIEFFVLIGILIVCVMCLGIYGYKN